MDKKKPEATKLADIDLAKLRRQHEIYKLSCEIADFRVRTMLADIKYMELVTQVNGNKEQEDPTKDMKPEQLFNFMKDNGFSDAQIEQELNRRWPDNDEPLPEGAEYEGEADLEARVDAEMQTS